MSVHDVEPADEMVPTMTLVAAGIAGAVLAALGLVLGAARLFHHS
jgi:hypothetical protein